MPIRVKCDNCKTMLKVRDELAGKKVKCKVCQSGVVVPSAAQKAPLTPQPTTAPVKKKQIPVGKPASEAIQSTKKIPTAEAKKPPSKAKPETNGAMGTPTLPEPEPPAVPEKPPEIVEEEAANAIAEALAPKEEVVDETPKTIDFKCNWCDEELHLPLDLAGKQTQCPNEECRRIIKVPLPKVVEKKDWRKLMDRRGPSAAIMNQPEQLEGAWDTLQNATRARATSMEQAGAVDLPPKPPIGLIGWTLRGFYLGCVLGILTVVCMLGAKVILTTQQTSALKEMTKLLEPEPKIADPLLRAEAYRTLALLHLQEGKREKAKQMFLGAQSLIVLDPEDSDRALTIHEQFALIELAVSELELGSSKEDDDIRKVKFPWVKVGEVVEAALKRIQDAEVQVIGLREVITRLREKKQDAIASSLAGNLSSGSQVGVEPPLTLSQQIALRSMQPDEFEKLKKEGKLPDKTAKDFRDAPARIGFAEGFARQNNYPKALELAQIPGPPKDRLATCLGVAAIAMSDSKTKQEADPFLKEALAIVSKAPDDELSPWLLLYLVRLGARADLESDSTWKELPTRLGDAFQLRVQLEFFLAECDKAQGPVSADLLAPIENADKEASTTLLLAWHALARQHARKGVKLAQMRKTLTDRLGGGDAAVLDKIRPVVDAGWYLGTVK